MEGDLWRKYTGGRFHDIPLWTRRNLLFAQLPYLKTTTLAGGQSSFDRTGGNLDYSNFLYDDMHGDHVLLDLTGSGTVYRFWCIFDPSRLLATLKVYFDGEHFPRINCLYRDLFAGHNAPFLAPLVGTDQASSGGYYCYLPLPFRHAIKITSNVKITSDVTSNFYYNIGYHLYRADASVTTWTGSEDSSAARHLWCQSFIGREPEPYAGAKRVSGSFDLASGATQTILDMDGPGLISAVKLRMPRGDRSPHRFTATLFDGKPSLTDTGRAHQGISRFAMALAWTNQGALLRRRLDYGVGDQCADVYVDGALVGSWRTAGSDTHNRWRDSSFYIPASFTASKMSVAVKLRYVSSQIDWNEFRYTMVSITGDGNIETDALDVGDPTSEEAHDYAITRQTWVGTQTYTYPMPSAATMDILNDIWLPIFWDKEDVPSVSAPLGSLFGMGQFGSAGARALPMGIDDNDWLYLYFPLPFQSHARIDLQSQYAGGVVQGDYLDTAPPLYGVLLRYRLFSCRVSKTTAHDLRARHFDLRCRRSRPPGRRGAVDGWSHWEP